MALKIGCTVWTLLKPNYTPPYEEAVRKVGQYGFDGIELPICNKKDIENYWTLAKIKEIRGILSEQRLELSQLCMFQNLMGGLASLDTAKKKESLENFETGCKIAGELEADFISFVSPWPEDITGRTTATLPEYFYLNVPDMITPGMEDRCVEGWRFEAKFRMFFPKPFHWNDYWNNFIDSMKRVDEIAQRNGIRVTVENRNNTMTPHTDSMLRMFHAVGSSNIGANFNTVQAFLHREILEWAVHKYGKKLFHVRAGDGDGLACYNLPVGDGIIDWKGLIYGLNEIGYDGFLSFEWLNDSEKEEHVKKSLAYIRELMN